MGGGKPGDGKRERNTAFVWCASCACALKLMFCYGGTDRGIQSIHVAERVKAVESMPSFLQEGGRWTQAGVLNSIFLKLFRVVTSLER